MYTNLKILRKIIFAFTLFFCISIYAQDSNNESELFQWLSSKQELIVKKIEGDSTFSEVYEIFITQPADHNDPNSITFKKKLYLSHRDKNKPMVVELDGYSVRNRPNELSKILNSNQILVEHRYYGESLLGSLSWQFMDFRQAAADHHRIIELFKEYYTGKWVSTGISKGGSTIMFHRRFYPDDVDASVSYVGPINLSPEDQRVYEYIKNVSTPECRKKVKDFQILCFNIRDELYPMFLDNAQEKSLSYNIVGSERAYEYSVLEYSFAYWQWSDGDCTKIPDSISSVEEIFEHLNQFGGIEYFSDKDIAGNWPFFYQCYTNYGYYAYETEQFQDHLKYADGHTKFFLPEGINPVFDPLPMKDISNWVTNEADKFIFIYGENDPWTATGVCLSGKTNSIKMVHPGGSHRTRIKQFNERDKEIIYSKLEEWLDLKIER